MIAYLEKYDTTAEVPDDAGEKDVKDINDNFHSYVDTKPAAEAETPASAAPPSPGTPPPTDIEATQEKLPEQETPKWQPNFYEAALSRLMAPIKAVGAATESPEAQVFAAKTAEELSFGLTKPLAAMDPALAQAEKDHPAFATAGEVTGGVGSLLEVGGALRIAGLAAPAEEAGTAAVKAGFAAGSRFIPRAIMAGATFGTRTFIAETVKAFEEGGVNLEQFGKDVLKDTAFGTIFGSIGGMEKPIASISSAGALGFISSKMQGGDNREAALNAAIWGAFETVGSLGKSEQLRMESLNNLKGSIGEYARGRNPDLTPEQARGAASAFVDHAVTKAGFKDAEAIAKSGPENLLEGIEKVNQMVRTAQIPHPGEPGEPLPKLPEPVAPETPAAAPIAPEAPKGPLDKAIETVKGMMGIKPAEPAPPPAAAGPQPIEKSMADIGDRLTIHGLKEPEKEAIFNHYAKNIDLIRQPIEDQYKEVAGVLNTHRLFNPNLESPTFHHGTSILSLDKILHDGELSPAISSDADNFLKTPAVSLSRNPMISGAFGNILFHIDKSKLPDAYDANIVKEHPGIEQRVDRPIPLGDVKRITIQLGSQEGLDYKFGNSKTIGEYIEEFKKRGIPVTIEKGDHSSAATMDQAEKAVDLINDHFNPKSQEVLDFAKSHPEASVGDVAQMAHNRGMLESPNPDLLMSEMKKASQEKIVTHPQMAQTAKDNVFYHGSGTKDISKIDPNVTSHEGLFGQGFYVTTNPEVAKDYAKARGKGGGEYVYKAILKEGKTLDLESPLHDDFKEVILDQAKSISQRFGYDFPGKSGEPSAGGLIEGIKSGAFKTNQDLFKAFRQMVSEISHDQEIPTSEFVEDFQELTSKFRDKGYDALTYTGGLRQGQGKYPPHKVMVVLNPDMVSSLGSESGAVMIPPDLVDVANHIRESSEEIRNLVAPANAAPLAAQITRANLGKMARSYDMAEASLSDASKLFEKQPKEANIDFIDRIERGQPQVDPKFQPFADKLRDLLDAKRAEIQALGTGKLKSFNENYFPHIWDQGEKEVGAAVQKGAKRPFEGSKAFLKARTIEFTKEGVEAGLTPVSYNPVDLTLLKMREMDKYIMAHQTLNEFKENGLAQFVRVGADIPDGWQKIDDRISTVMFKGEQGLTISGHIYAQPDAARIINNYLSPGLQNSKIFQAYRFAGNLMNQFQLSMSAFHLGFVGLEGSVSKLSLAIRELSKGNPLTAIRDAIKTPFAAISTVIRGDQMLKAWRGEGQNGVDNILATAMAEGGGRARMDQFYATRAYDQMKHYFDTGRVFKGILSAPLAALDLSMKPTLEYYVPRMKLGAFADIMEMEMRNNSNMSHDQTRQIAQRAWDSIDNRFGQLVYDNLFWNRTFKDLLMASQRSVGWNLGTIRELGGGVIDALKQPFEGKNAEVTDKMGHLIALPLLVGALGAMITYLKTGKGPKELKDYYYPPTGGSDAAGDAHRIALPSYMKDIYHYTQDPLKTISNKLSPLLSTISEMLEDKDYYGTKIRNEDDPLVKQVMAEAAFIGKQLTPFSIRNMQKNLETGNHSLFDTVGPWVGVTPAPYDIDQTKAEKTAHEISMSHQSIGGRTEEQAQRSRLLSELTRNYKMGDPKAVDHIEEAYQKGLISHRQMQNVIVNAGMTPLQRMVKGMTLEEAERVYGKANDEEKAQIGRMVERKKETKEKEYVTP